MGMTTTEGKVRLTKADREALEWLDAMRVKFPTNDYGFNPQPGARGRYETCRRRLEQRGFVWINRRSERHFRYAITDAGRAALSPEREGGE